MQEQTVSLKKILSRCATVNLPGLALSEAKAGNSKIADAVELEHIKRTQLGVTTKDGQARAGNPKRLIRGYGPTGRLAVEWCTMDGTIYYADIDGKEI